MSVTALLPAHNEHASLPAAIASLRSQTLPPDRIIVVADNCTDDTEGVARSLGCEVFVTERNVDKKAGALNQCISSLRIENSDYLLVQDADSRIDKGFLAAALAQFPDPYKGQPIGAVGGIFLGDPVKGRYATKAVSFLQMMEYVRYQREVLRSEKVWVLTGTATVLSGHVVKTLLAERGYVYDPSALTEDMELTLAVKDRGYAVVSPPECIVRTETMPTWAALFRQRLRWQRGALENLRTYGVRNRVTWPYLRQQAMMAVGAVALALYLILTALIIVTGQIGLSWFWLGVGGIFLTERIVTVWSAGAGARWVAATLIPDLLYDLFLQSVLVRAAADTVMARPQVWHHDTGRG